MTTNVNLIDYTIATRLATADLPFASFISAAIMRADTHNMERLASLFPLAVRDTLRRYNAPGGALPEECPEDADVDSEQLNRIVSGYLCRIPIK